LPQLLEPTSGPWTIHESKLDHAAVDTEHREAWVPVAGTLAQQMARLHEAKHAQKSPRNWLLVVKSIVSEGVDRGLLLDAKAVLHLAKMLEENRIDWLLWSENNVDIRPCRDSLDWSKMTIPEEDELLEATAWVLQLAWTVWASVGFGNAKLKNPPPPRDPDREAEVFFEACWKTVQKQNMDLARAIIRACLEMYHDPSPATRDEVTLELATFFPIDEPPELPEEKEEEKEEQRELEQKEQAKEEQQDEDEEGGVKNSWTVLSGNIQYHDHTKGRRRPKVTIHKGWRPTDFGFKVRYPHRYTIDKSIFGVRAASEGSLMIDFSQSMKWDNSDLLFLLEQMPEIFIAGYTGVHDPQYYGRICVIAQDGRFNVFNGIDPECDGNNAIDLEALELLAKKPAPRFWLSDGMVTEGRHIVPYMDSAGRLEPYLTKPFEKLPPMAKGFLGTHHELISKVNALMKRAEIIRVPNAETMRALATGKRVTVYRTCTPEQPVQRTRWYGDAIEPAPVKFQL
jgi:hypothetical protein